MVDISFQGASLALTCEGLGRGVAGTNVLLDFGDEGAPVEIQQNEVVGISGNFNGTLITWSRYQPIRMEISLIPGSSADVALRELLYASHLGGKGGQAVSQQTVIIKSATLTTPAIFTQTSIQGMDTVSQGSVVETRFTFGPGRLTTGQLGIGANGEGKMTMRRYSFVFEGAKEPVAS